jgi:integrase
MATKEAEKREKRANGEGAISHRKDGRIEVKYTLPNGKRASVYGRTRADALKKKDEALKKARKGIDLRAERQSLGTYLNAWFADVATPKNRPSKLKSYRSYLDKHIIPELGDVALCDLTPQAVQAFLNGRSKAGLSPRTVQYIRAILRAALAQAMRWGYVERNVAALASPPRMVRQPVTPLDAAQAQRLIDHTREDRLGTLFAVAVYTGLRQGELLGLRWPDLDLDAGTLAVRQAVQKIDGAWQFLEPKSDRGRRTIPLPPMAVAALRDQKARIREARMVAGSRWIEWGLVFPSTLGTPLDGSNVTHRLQAALAAADLPRQRFHDLRHCCATLLLTQGVPARVVQDVLGHSQVTLTLGTYSHVMPAMLQESADAMERAFGTGR